MCPGLYFGAIVDTHLGELQTLLSRYNLSEEETRVAEESLDKLLIFTIVYFDDLE